MQYDIIQIRNQTINLPSLPFKTELKSHKKDTAIATNLKET